MYLEQITVAFSYQERRKFNQAMNHYKPQKGISFQKNQAEYAEHFKSTILSYLNSVKNIMFERNYAIEQIKELLRSNKCFPQSREMSLQKQYRQIGSGIRLLKELLRQKQNDSESYNLYVTYLTQLRDLKQSTFSQFEANISKHSSLNYQQRQNLRHLANKIRQCSQAEQAQKTNGEISQFLTEILRYGFGRQILSLSAISDKTLHKKCQALVENIVNNYIQIQPQFKYANNGIHSLIQKLADRNYTRQEVGKILQRLPQKIKTLFEPLIAYVFALRSNPVQKNPPYVYSRAVYYDSQIKKAEEESLKQLVADCAIANAKNDKLQAELKKVKWFIRAVGGLSSAYKQQSIHKQLAECLELYEDEDTRFNLLKIYEKFNNYGYKQPLHKTFKESRENQLLSKKVSKLQQEISKYKEQSKELEQQKAQSLSQRIQLLEDIEHYKQLIDRKNQQVTQMQTNIKILQKVQKENTELQNLIKILQEKGEQKSMNNAYEITKNHQLQQTLKICVNQKQALQERIKLLNQQLQQKSEKEVGRVIEENELQRKERLNHIEPELILQKEQLKGLIMRLQSQMSELRKQNSALNLRNDQLADLQGEVEKLTSQNDILTEKLQLFINSKSTLSQKAHVLDEEKQALAVQVRILKEELQFLLQNQMQTKQRQQFCNRQIESLKFQFQLFVSKYDDLSRQYESKAADLEELKGQNYNLMNEVKRMADLLSQKSSVSKPDQESRQNYKILEKELQQSRKLNQLIKTEYLSFKEQTKNAFKAKYEGQIASIRQNQQKLKENYKKLYDHFMAMNEKMNALKKENDELLLQKRAQNAQQLGLLTYQSERSQIGQKYKEIALRYQSLKTLSQREMVKKEEQIANLKLELIRSQRMSQSNSVDQHQQQIKNEKMEYMESEIAELEQVNSRMKMQLQRKEQEILILKMQKLR